MRPSIMEKQERTDIGGKFLIRCVNFLQNLGNLGYFQFMWKYFVSQRNVKYFREVIKLLQLFLTTLKFNISYLALLLLAKEKKLIPIYHLIDFSLSKIYYKDSNKIQMTQMNKDVFKRVFFLQVAVQR